MLVDHQTIEPHLLTVLVLIEVAMEQVMGFVRIIIGVRKIALQLTVVSTPSLNKTLSSMRGPPTLPGWCPTRRRYVE